jgi:hypothetical protein
MTTTSFKIADQLYLVSQTVSKTKAVKAEPPPTNHIAVIDCSGSMSWDLPKIREQLKRRIPKILKAKDTLSLIWFSGRGQHGVLLEAEPVSTLADLQDVNKAIDRWLSPVGMTGFKEPMEDVVSLVKKIKKNGNTFSLFFMSDGCDNQWSRAEILQAVEKAAGGLASATFVEYGYYADRPLLTAMAEKAGGQLIFAEDFDRYEPQFEAAVTKGISGAPRIEVKLDSDLVCELFAFSMDGDALTTYSAEDGPNSSTLNLKVKVPEDLTAIYYLSPKPVGKEGNSVNTCTQENGVEAATVVAAAYAAVSLFSIRMKPNTVYPLLKALGDVALIEDFSGCFGKQKYTAFMEASKGAAVDASKRYPKGYDPTKVPAEDAFTVFDLLRILSQDDGNYLLLDHEAFKYSKIGRGRTDANAVLTKEEAAEVAKLTAEMGTTKDPAKIKDLANKIASITDKPAALKFEADKSDGGYAITNLTYNEERPNISVLVRKTGVVDLSGRLTAELKGKVPEKFPTFVFRNYAIVKDGLINVEVLPCKLSEATRKALPADIITEKDGVTLVSLKGIPVVNRQMVKEASAKDLFELEHALTVAKAVQKVYNHYKKELLGGRKSEGFEAKYGAEAAQWLKDQGITDYSGFSPKSVTDEAKDFYMSKEMKVSLKGLASLPSVKDVLAKKASGKLNASAALMAPTVDEVTKFLTSDIYMKAAAKDEVLDAWLEGQSKAATAKARALIREKAQRLFTIVVGQVWFTEFSSLEENTLEITVGKDKILGKVEMVEKQTAI